MFDPISLRIRRRVSVFAVALLALQAAAPTAEILHEIRHVAESWESIPAASQALESAARGGCDVDRPEERGHSGEEHEDDGTCELCGSLAPLRVFSDASAGSFHIAADRAETIAPVTSAPTLRLLVIVGDPRGPPSPTV